MDSELDKLLEDSLRFNSDLYGEGVRARLSTMPMVYKGRKALLVTSIEVGIESRGKGFASRLLDHACEMADDEGMALVLQVQPDGTSDSVSEEVLLDWYSSRGFVHDSSGGDESMMVREPKMGCQR